MFKKGQRSNQESARKERCFILLPNPAHSVQYWTPSCPVSETSLGCILPCLHDLLQAQLVLLGFALLHFEDTMCFTN